jgi:hypothetical protein
MHQATLAQAGDLEGATMLRHRPHRILYVPANDQPCAVHWPRLLGRMVGWDLVMPLKEWLGWFYKPGRPAEIWAWALETAREPLDGAVLSLDMLVYGGLLAAATATTPTPVAQRRMDNLARLREALGPLPILGFFSILGLTTHPRNDDALRYLDQLRQYALLAGRAEASANTERQRLEELETALPAALLQEYLAVRERNHQLNQRALEEVAKGNLDYLVLAQQPAGTEGSHRAEQAALLDRAAELGVADRVCLCGGGEEQGMVLIARLIHEHMNKQPRVRAWYSSEPGAERIAAGEDRPLQQQLAAVVSNVGARLSTQEAEVAVVVNCPLPASRAILDRPPASEQRKQELRTLLQQAQEAAGGRALAIVDTAFADGADSAFMEALLEHGQPLPRLLAASAWGHASQSLAVGLAHATLRLIALQDKGAFDLVQLVADLTPVRYLALLDAIIESEKAHVTLLFSRLIEDWLYQTRIRPQVEEHVVGLLRSSALDLRRLHDWTERMVCELLTEAVADLWIEHFLGRSCVDIGMEPHRSALTLAELEETHFHLPWGRLAEIEIAVRFGVELAAR